MTVASKAAGLSFFALGLIARQATAQATAQVISDCEELKSAVENASSELTVTIGANFECATFIPISGKTTINGGKHTISFASTFVPDDDIGSGLFAVEAEGTLELYDLTIMDATDKGNRGIYNKGTLTVNNCEFSQLGIGSGDDAFVENGAAIFTISNGNEVTIQGSTFSSNVVTTRGGAICAAGKDVLIVSGSVFSSNEAGGTGGDAGAGGDIYAARDATLTVMSSNFSQSSATYGGAAIECCGAEISDSSFTGTDTAMDDAEHYGALLVGRPGEDPCGAKLLITGSKFTRCTVDVGLGVGGSMAIFDTEATVEDCTFESSQGTAVLFQSSDPDTPHQLSIKSSHFYSNSRPAQEYSVGGSTQGTALAIQNTGLEDGEEPAMMGEFFNVFCFENEPYECEFVYHNAEVEHDGEFKCQICNEDGERQDPGTDDFLSGSDRGTGSGSDSSDGIVIGLSLALGLTLVVIGALAVWKFRVRKNARRLMEDMGEGDL